MKTTQSWVIAGALGFLIGVASMHFMSGNHSQAAGLDGNKQFSKLLARMDQMESTLNTMRDNYSDYATRSSGFSNTQQSSVADNGCSGSNPAQATGNDTTAAAQVAATKNQATAEQDEETTQVIESRLQDPDYTNYKTLPELMQSDEMAKLSPKARARVVSKIVGMINHGELNLKSFVPNLNTAQ